MLILLRKEGQIQNTKFKLYRWEKGSYVLPNNGPSQLDAKVTLEKTLLLQK
jgi:hypothetical protein